MAQNEIIENYMRKYNEIREHAKMLNYTDSQIDKCYQDSLKILKTNETTKFTLILRLLTVFIFFLLFIYILLYVHQPTSSLVLQNVQSFIYPGFQVLRSLAIPIISFFPKLTALYDETCLLENSYFQVTNLDCHPCKHIYYVINFTGVTINPSNFSIYESGTPFVIADTQKVVTLNDIASLYKANQQVFDENFPWMITTNNVSFTHIGQVFKEETISHNDYIHWRINCMLPGRVLRKLFPRPPFISEWSGQSIERYLLMDGPNTPGYSLPSFECSYIFIIQGSGERDIILEATPECRESCRTISIRMKPSYTLWYNWWYWKPLSLPAENATAASISYISSYC